jgi:hypothetical protein
LGVGPWIVFKFLKDKSFLIESDGMLGIADTRAYPDPEVMRRRFNDPASRFEGVIRIFIMGAKQGAQMI